MAIDEQLVERVRRALGGESGVREVRMFGGLGFMLNGHLLACADTRGLLVRVGETGQPDALAQGAKPMLMNGRQMKGFVRVEGALDARAVSSWLRRAQAFVAALPAKQSSAGPVRKESVRKESVRKEPVRKRSKS